MNVHKIIKFYVLEPSPSLAVNGLNYENLNTTTYIIFKSAFPQIDFYDMEFEKKMLFFDIKKYDNEKMFGTCSTNETIRATNFMQKRDKNTKEATPYTTIGNEEQLESYTFFYIDFLNNRMAVISNKKIAKIHEALSQFIWEKSGNLYKISIFPEMIDDIKSVANKLLNPSWLEIEFAKRNCTDDIPHLKKALGSDFQTKQYKLKVRLEEKHNSALIDRIINLKKDYSPDDISLLKLYGKNDLGLDETINFIETVYMKTVPLELTDDTATNIDYLENRLKEFLDIHLGDVTKGQNIITRYNKIN